MRNILVYKGGVFDVVVVAVVCGRAQLPTNTSPEIEREWARLIVFVYLVTQADRRTRSTHYVIQFDELPV